MMEKGGMKTGMRECGRATAGFPAVVLFAFALLAIAMEGCVANDANAMPWAAPDPNESSINLPGAFSRP